MRDCWHWIAASAEVQNEDMIIDAMMPRYDVVLTQHCVVAADPHRTLQAACDLDLLTVRTPILLTAMWLRGLPARLAGKASPPPGSLVIADGGLPGWLVFGRDEQEMAFGAVGVFWRPVIEWRDVSAAEFAGFAEPGWGQIAANFSVLPYGERSLLTYECRTATTDPLSRRRFLRYWWLVRPFVAHIMRATLATIKADAEVVRPTGAGARSAGPVRPRAADGRRRRSR
ncbi:hypothetical protein BH11ACT7_BH11ACT7_42130 [soil metagenome]